MFDELTERTRTAQADAEQEQGRLRRPYGGDSADLPGIRLWSSGIPAPQWNGGEVTDADKVDLAAVRDWFAARHVPWGVRVPAGMHWPHGRYLRSQRLMALEPGDFVPAPGVAGIEVRHAVAAHLPALLEIDAAAFGVDDPEQQRRWIEPHLNAFGVTVAVAQPQGGVPVAHAYTVRSDGRAGAALLLGGVGVRPESQHRGIGAQLSSWLVAQGLESGVDLVHLNPDTEEALRVYARLGFVEVGGLEIYVDN